MNDRELTQGSVFRNLLRFSLPYLLSCFLQTFYGLADLYMVGQFNGASAIMAVSVGSQLMHMLTVVIVGLAMGSTVFLSRTVGAGDTKTAAKGIGSTVRLFSWTALGLTALLLLGTEGLLRLLSVPGVGVTVAANYFIVSAQGLFPFRGSPKAFPFTRHIGPFTQGPFPVAGRYVPYMQEILRF